MGGGQRASERVSEPQAQYYTLILFILLSYLWALHGDEELECERYLYPARPCPALPFVERKQGYLLLFHFYDTYEIYSVLLSYPVLYVVS